ncbi:prepilin-type N-terminal cleavage/methylation domain-containing protein [Candidatus Kaiserbacteria bacterium]|nr:prepilin-type N-terminal cleavage/methylation domain-containing protein [Candidatus Kaiserbacteria bacterium]
MRTATQAKGFTLIEILLVVGILVLLFAIGLFMSMDVYRSYSRRSERDTVVAILQRARSRAMANINQSVWGVCMQGDGYRIFKGTTYSADGVTETIEGNPSVIITDTSATQRFACADGGIVFAQLSGDTTDQMITVVQAGIASTISTNVLGRIDW